MDLSPGNMLAPVPRPIRTSYAFASSIGPVDGSGSGVSSSSSSSSSAAPTSASTASAFTAGGGSGGGGGGWSSGASGGCSPASTGFWAPSASLPLIVQRDMGPEGKVQTREVDPMPVVSLSLTVCWLLCRCRGHSLAFKSFMRRFKSRTIGKHPMRPLIPFTCNRVC